MASKGQRLTLAAGLLGFGTEEAAMRLGQTLGGLLNATLGNAVELIVAILALVKVSLEMIRMTRDRERKVGTGKSYAVQRGREKRERGMRVEVDVR